MSQVVENGSHDKFGRFLWIDNIVKRYPAYTHDDVFYFEADFAMNLLMLAKDDLDFSRRYDREVNRRRKLKQKGGR